MTSHPLRVVNERWIFHFPQLLVLSPLDYCKKFQGIWLGAKKTVASHLFPGNITQTSNSFEKLPFPLNGASHSFSIYQVKQILAKTIFGSHRVLRIPPRMSWTPSKEGICIRFHGVMKFRGCKAQQKRGPCAEGKG